MKLQSAEDLHTRRQKIKNLIQKFENRSDKKIGLDQLAMILIEKKRIVVFNKLKALKQLQNTDYNNLLKMYNEFYPNKINHKPSLFKLQQIKLSQIKSTEVELKQIEKDYELSTRCPTLPNLISKCRQDIYNYQEMEDTILKYYTDEFMEELGNIVEPTPQVMERGDTNDWPITKKDKSV
tara:strand:+ start:4929 stop:5468 length:540 start_codon:yes stop_codon:yes gene_type:complete